jgi:CTP synthase (UTP-ammonia lyase)
MNEIVGDRDPRHRTHRAFDAALGRFPADVRARWVDTNSPDMRLTSEADGVWLASGSPIEMTMPSTPASRRRARLASPFLGTCGGFQYALVEFARHVAGLRDADHAETTPEGQTLVVARLPCSLVGQERVITALSGTRLQAICGSTPFVGFHWCSFRLPPAFVETLTGHGLVIGAHADDAGVEAIEIPTHPSSWPRSSSHRWARRAKAPYTRRSPRSSMRLADRGCCRSTGSDQADPVLLATI